MGSYATTPFFIDKQHIYLYSIEEVCYYIRENICLLDKGIMTPAFIRFLEAECNLSELATNCKQLLHKKASLSTFCAKILSYAGNLSEEEVASLEETIKESNYLNAYEKRKSNADYFVRKKKYYRATQEYWQIMNEPNKPEPILLSKIMHNMGVVYANVFYFKRAAEWFKEAYQLGEREESMLCYLVSLQMGGNDSEYMDWMAAHPEAYEQTKLLEKQMDEIKQEWQESMLYGSQESMNGSSGKNSEYYDMLEQGIAEWKEEYREYTEG